MRGPITFRAMCRHVLHDLVFCMALETIDELKIHGRALAPRERFGERLLNRLRRL
jgi:hypothetical protein